MRREGEDWSEGRYGVRGGDELREGREKGKYRAGKRKKTEEREVMAERYRLWKEEMK